jgi:ribonucleoside-diphosphate reductase alpha chain
MPGPQTPASIATFQQRYCQPGETYREVCNRVAASITDNSGHYHEMREIMLGGYFVPAGRVLASAGSTKRIASQNCFVSGPIPDSLAGIMDRLKEAARTMQMGGGIGYDFSTLRPEGDPVRSVQGKASGPIPYIHMYNAMGETISSAGERRGAQMGVLRVDHPDIEAFINAKHNQDKLKCFNLSVAVTDAFMRAVQHDGIFNLIFEGRVYRTINARNLWEAIMRSTWDWAEPGVVFIDRINHWNNLGYCETICATNPCSEQPLPPFGACLLGSFNLVSYLQPFSGPRAACYPRYKFDWSSFREHIPVVVRAMDNVIDVALYPLEEQRKEALATRRMGLGPMGLANCLEALGLPYGSVSFIQQAEDILSFLKNHAYTASAQLAKEKGAFPLFLKDAYMARPFIQGLAPTTQASIELNGVRNSHLTSIAPTGTISFCMNNVSSGIEPVFSKRQRRQVRGLGEVEVGDYGAAKLGVDPTTADMVTAEQHVAVLCAAQRHTDSAVSKTCNVSSSMPWEEFKDLYFQAWKGGAKSCSTFQNGGNRVGVLEAVKDCVNGKCDGSSIRSDREKEIA